jgi:hypothetical protein
MPPGTAEHAHSPADGFNSRFLREYAVPIAGVSGSFMVLSFIEIAAYNTPR